MRPVERFLFCVLFSTLASSGVESLRVLVQCPTLSRSHVQLMSRLTETLVHAGGHEVTMFMPELDGRVSPPQSTSATVIFNPGKNPTNFSTLFKEQNPFDEMPMYSPTAFQRMFVWMDLIAEECDWTLTNERLMQRLRDQKFDVTIVEMYDYCGLGIAHLLDLPYIWMSSMPLTEQMAAALGVPWPTSYVPVIFAAMGDRMSYVERLKSFIGYNMVVQLALKTAVAPMQQVFRRHFGPEFPSVWELAGRAPIAFVNSEELLDFPRPILHKTVYIGGFSLAKPKPLDRELEALMNKSKDGVVLVSFGSIARSADMHDDMKIGLLQTLARFPKTTFIWKYEEPNETMTVGYPNVRLMKWTPQTDLLAHPNLRAFVTHAGYNSILEATAAGKPLVTVPLFADQYRNSRAAQRQGVAIEVDKVKLGRDGSLYEALDAVLNTPTYGENAQKLARMIAKKPVKAEELILKWTEFVAEFRTLPNLEPYGRKMSAVQYYGLDVIVPVVGGFLLLLLLLLKVVFLCVRMSVRVVARSSKEKSD